MTTNTETRPVYADTDAGRLGAQMAQNHDPGAEPMVAVWYANGPQIGFYRLTRFEGGKVTAATMRKLFAR